jgi:hypothetical protein
LRGPCSCINSRLTMAACSPASNCHESAELQRRRDESLTWLKSIP